MTIFIFANTEKARKSIEQPFSLVENRHMIRIGITIDIIVGRTFLIVTISLPKSLRNNSREFRGVSGGFHYHSRVTLNSFSEYEKLRLEGKG